MASPCFCSASEGRWDNTQAQAPYAQLCQVLPQHTASCSEQPTLLLGKDFVTRANKTKQTQQVRGAQLEVVTHYTIQHN